MTGVYSNLSPNEFFDKCYDAKLTEMDISLIRAGQSIKGTVRRKMGVITNMMKLFREGLQAQENFQKNKVSCILATADDKCTLGFGGNRLMRPKTLLKGKELNNFQVVDLVLRRKSGAPFFDEIIVGDKKELDKYGNFIDHLLSDSIR